MLSIAKKGHIFKGVTAENRKSKKVDSLHKDPCNSHSKETVCAYCWESTTHDHGHLCGTRLTVSVMIIHNKGCT